jgi:hypothetical protein
VLGASRIYVVGKLREWNYEIDSGLFPGRQDRS